MAPVSAGIASHSGKTNVTSSPGENGFQPQRNVDVLSGFAWVARASVSSALTRADGYGKGGVSRFQRDVSTAAHRNSDTGGFHRGRIINAVAHHCQRRLLVKGGDCPHLDISGSSPALNARSSSPAIAAAAVGYRQSESRR